MALIEHMERNNWDELLRNFFEYTLEVLKHDPFRSVGSSVDDLRSWLGAGGVGRVKAHLTDQMTGLRYPPAKIAAVNAFVDQLAHEHRYQLLDLMAHGIIPAPQTDWPLADSVTDLDFTDLLSRILAGERPFEEWMHAHGHSDAEIAEVYRVIDAWLIRQGIIPPPGTNPRLN
jgi:hypothetical protein